MLFKYEDSDLKPLPYYNFRDLGGRKRDLEKFLAKNLNDLFNREIQLMPIYQEHLWRPDPDVVAVDKEGNLVIFEFKRELANVDAVNQLMRYGQVFGKKTYAELNALFQEQKDTKLDLKEVHATTFGLESSPLEEEDFNKNQKLIVVGSSEDLTEIENVEYWKSKNLDVDYLPYRFYKIKGEIYFEFFAKPYDYHINPTDRKALIFDTHREVDEKAIWSMLEDGIIKPGGPQDNCMGRFNIDDYILYYHKGFGIIGAGKIKTEVKRNEETEELYREVELLTPRISKEEEIKSISTTRLRKLLNKDFYFGSTIKCPHLTVKEAEILISELRGLYGINRTW